MKWSLVNIVLLMLALGSPGIALASHVSINSRVFNPSILAGPLVVCTGVPTQGTVNGQSYSFSACQNLCDLVAQIANLIYFMIAVVIWVVTPILVTGGGIVIMLGGANPGMIETGKRTITGTFWGVVIVLCAWLLVKAVVSPITGLGISGVGGFSTSSLGGAAAAPACNL